MGFLLLGVDSLIAGMAIGPVVERRWRLPLAVLFGIADAVVFLLAAGLGWQLFSEGVSVALGTGVLVAMGLWLLVVAAGTQRAAAYWPVWVLPWVLTLDNLAYGVAGDHPAGSLLGHAGEQAMSSALLGLAGLLVAVVLPRVLPAMHRRTVAAQFAGAALVLASGGLLLLG
jgi:hypothetical protein